MNSKIEDPVKMWKGYSYVGYWMEAYLTLDEKYLIVSRKKGKANWFQVNLKILETKEGRKKRDFGLQIGFKTLHFRADSRQTKQKWINAMLFKKPKNSRAYFSGRTTDLFDPVNNRSE